MHVVQAVDGSRRWVSGVFRSKAATDAYLAQIPSPDRAKHSVLDLVGLSYPLYICEDSAEGFRFLTEAEIVAELKQYATERRREDEDWCYTNLYRITDDWRPRRPGADSMGALPHYHVNNGILRCVEQDGFESLWR
jgi:hypothetical protein